MKKFKFYIALIVGRVVAFMVNIIDKEKGSIFLGKIACKLCRDFIIHFKNINLEKVIMVTGIQWKNNNH